MILSDFSYEMFNYDMFLKNFCAKFADYGKKQYLCRNKIKQGGGVRLPRLQRCLSFSEVRCFSASKKFIRTDDYEDLSREYYFYPFCRTF